MASADRAVEYRVQWGDTLSHIAARFGTDVADRGRCGQMGWSHGAGRLADRLGRVDRHLHLQDAMGTGCHDDCPCPRRLGRILCIGRIAARQPPVTGNEIEIAVIIKIPKGATVTTEYCSTCFFP